MICRIEGLIDAMLLDAMIAKRRATGQRAKRVGDPEKVGSMLISSSSSFSPSEIVPRMTHACIMSPCAYLLATTCSEAVGVQHSISPSSHDSARLCASAFVRYTRTYFIFYFPLVLLRSLPFCKVGTCNHMPACSGIRAHEQ